VGKEVLQQVLGLLTGLSDKEIAKVHSKTKPRKVKLTPFQETKLRQTQYKSRLKTGELLFGKKVR